MAKCKQCNGRPNTHCTRCGGCGQVPTPTQFIEAVRTASGNHLLNANQCLTWLQDLARK